MKFENGPEMRPDIDRAEKLSLPETLELIQHHLRIRDERQTLLLQLLAQPDKSGHVLTDAWLQLQLAQGDLDHHVENEISERLDNPRSNG